MLPSACSVLMLKHTIRTLVASCLSPVRSLPKGCLFTLSSSLPRALYKRVLSTSLIESRNRESPLKQGTMQPSSNIKLQLNN
eukprot:504095-Pelagomonas_calceolata.AAC.1